MKYKTNTIIYLSLFIALIYICGIIRINIFEVPFTLQTMAVMLAACFLGAKKAVAAVLIYIIMGLAGLPLFTQGGGFMYITKYSFGYILGFIPMSLLTGLYKDKCKNAVQLFLLLLFSGVLMLIIGALYAYILLSVTSGVDIQGIIYGYFLVFIPSEILKSIASLLIYLRLKKYLTV